MNIIRVDQHRTGFTVVNTEQASPLQIQNAIQETVSVKAIYKHRSETTIAIAIREQLSLLPIQNAIQETTIAIVIHCCQPRMAFRNVNL